MIIAPSAVAKFLARRLRDSAKAKRFSPKALDAKIRQVVTPLFEFPTPPLHHQKAIFLLMARRPRYLLLGDMGTAKTKSVYDAFRHARSKRSERYFLQGVEEDGEQLKMLVLVPGSHNVREWVLQAAEHAPGLRVNAVDAAGSEARWELLEDPKADACVLTYAGFLKLVSQPHRKRKRGWELDPKQLRRMSRLFEFFVADECTAFANNTTLTHRACRKVSWAASHSYGLTGTAFGGDPEDLWGLFYVVDKGETLGETKGLFRAAYFKEVPDPWSGFPTYKVDKKRLPLLRRALRHNSIRYRLQEVTDLKEPIRQTVPCDWDPEVLDYYDRQVEALVEAARGGKARLVDNEWTRLRQLTAGYLVMKGPKGEDGVIQFKRNPKLDALVEDLKALPRGAKAVVFHWYGLSGDVICERLKKERVRFVRLTGGMGRKAGEVVDRFKADPRVPVLVSSSAGAYGGNWQVARYAFLFESPSDPRLRKQEEGRVWRIGQPAQVVLRSYVVADSVDEKIEHSIRAGRDLFDSVLDGRGAADLRRAGYKKPRVK